MNHILTYALTMSVFSQNAIDSSNNKRMLKLALRSDNHSQNTKYYVKKNRNNMRNFNHVYYNKDMNHFKRNKQSQN